MADETFGSRLRAARKGLGLTQAQLAERSGLHLVNVCQIETGAREPKIGTARRLADALGVSLDRLVPPTPGD
jgi:transcriptional regulator with XRE-family HTH domain